METTSIPKCKYCNDTGIVYDWVDYGSTVVSMPSLCDCEAGAARMEDGENPELQQKEN